MLCAIFKNARKISYGKSFTIPSNPQWLVPYPYSLQQGISNPKKKKNHWIIQPFHINHQLHNHHYSFPLPPQTYLNSRTFGTHHQWKAPKKYIFFCWGTLWFAAAVAIYKYIINQKIIIYIYYFYMKYIHHLVVVVVVAYYTTTTIIITTTTTYTTTTTTTKK